jgi:hypothetical protein
MEHEIPTASLGGPKTKSGKATSSMNAVTHGVLRETLTPYEDGLQLDVLEKLRQENPPSSTLEELLLERIATHYVKLHRVSKAEREYVQSVLDPHIVKQDPTFSDFDSEVVVNQGYVPKVGVEAVERLLTVYARYETNLENRLFRAIHELRELKMANAM